MGMRTKRLMVAALAAVAVPLLAAPGRAGSAEETAQGRRITGTVWMRTMPAEPAGSFRVFLANGTTLSGSCTETYRVDPWRSGSAARVTVTEDGVAIPIDVSFVGQELRLRLRLRDGVREERYRAARVPFLCPSTRR